MAHITILIVDDEPNQRFILERALHMFNPNWQTVATATGSEALEAIEKQLPDLIITDYHMPNMTGLELIDIIRKRNINTPIILMTAYGTPELQRASEGLGIAHFLTKPVPLTTLRRLTVAALRDHPLMILDDTQETLDLK